MNLHILPDSKFTDAFYLNMKEAGLLENNRFVVRSNAQKLKYVKQPISFAPLYSSDFSRCAGDVSAYERVFIHQLSPLMYRWIAKHNFRELNWMTWGTDLYNLPFVKTNFHERETLPLTKERFDFFNFLYLLKVYFTSMPFKRKAYSKVKNILTWMQTEFNFARIHIPELQASHRDFFYENQIPYEKIDTIIASEKYQPAQKLKLIIGNSGTASNNHLDAIRLVEKSGIEADLFIPVSYGDPTYISSLKKSTGFYKKGTIHFMDGFMEFEEYVRFLYSVDALVMNHIRPQGYGNIFMMMYMNKPVLLNKKNISLPDLSRAGIQWITFDDTNEWTNNIRKLDNKERVTDLLSHDRLLNLYRDLFN